ncbi:radical SAM protein [Aestuariivirga litoralis]|uniref:Radical SAM protein n=1 Tax=Aestuariivirga litoralis TaxID=2650924 RepID=A0A2W2AQW3_9HYPH|nr:radical SAM protein [Aestuariivirga litoralis]PZF76022.1 radical SAM protein [Aestuariivirga litoralis]
MNAPVRKVAPYVFYGQTTSMCDDCMALVPAKIIIEDNSVYYLKRCREHGVQKALVSTDAQYYKLCHDYLKPGDRPLQPQTRTENGCPYDCGLCPDHEQHSCLALIEVNEACNLTCPVCFAASSAAKTTHRPLAEIERMMDALVASEGEPDLLQISGGEPTIHPQILDIIAAAKRRPIRHVMLNTNGIRIAQEPDFVKALAGFKPGFEVYLQFDSLRPAVLKNLRGADLTRIRRQALEALERENISTTLVVVVKAGQNDDELGEIIDFALQWRCVRGITFQPVQDAGRNEGFDPGRDRIVLSDIRRRIVEAGTPFGAGDIIPLPCNPESIAIGYALRKGSKIAPITSFFPRDMLVEALPNAITFEKYPELHSQVLNFFSLSTAECNNPEKLNALLCCLPEVPVPEGFGYENIFRIAIVEFMDRHNFCVGRVKRSCIHFVTPNGQIIPFETYNMFYRDEAARARMARSRGQQ